MRATTFAVVLGMASVMLGLSATAVNAADHSKDPTGPLNAQFHAFGPAGVTLLLQADPSAFGAAPLAAPWLDPQGVPEQFVDGRIRGMLLVAVTDMTRREASEFFDTLPVAFELDGEPLPLERTPVRSVPFTPRPVPPELEEEPARGWGVTFATPALDLEAGEYEFAYIGAVFCYDDEEDTFVLLEPPEDTCYTPFEVLDISQ